MNNKIFKEAIIIFLLFIVIVFVMGILFYDSMTENVEDIASVEYVTSQAANQVLEEIDANGGVNVKDTTSDSLLKSYSINAEDLSDYASENYYESGKKDPFAESSETIDEYTTTTVQTGTATKSQTSNPLDTLQNTVANDKKTTNTVANTVTNTVKNTVKNTTNNTVKNTVSLNTNKVVNNTAKDKNESSSTTGTFFEDKNSK